MGQLEKYGLYVLCLVIFLILGVTIWGGGEVAAGRSSAVAMHAVGGVNARSPDGGSVAASRSRSLDLLLPAAPPPQEPRPVPGSDRSSAGGSQPTREEPARPAADGPATEFYTVQDGDSFEGIAAARLGSRAAWTEIQQLNPGVDPRRLRPGQQIKLPSAAAGAARERSKPARGGSTEVRDGGRSYTVKKGDTIEGIALNVLGSRARRDELLALNPTARNVIRPGDVLKLPAK